MRRRLADGLNLTEADLDAWFPTFLAQYTEEEQVIIEKCRVLWTEDADEEREVRCGFPKSPADIKALFESGRLDAELFEPELSAAEMLIINAASATTALEFKDGTRTTIVNGETKPVACPRCHVIGSCPGPMPPREPLGFFEPLELTEEQVIEPTVTAQACEPQRLLLDDWGTGPCHENRAQPATAPAAAQPRKWLGNHQDSSVEPRPQPV